MQEPPSLFGPSDATTTGTSNGTGSTQTPLYGGAILVSIPASYADVSSIRDVPSHQEVFLARRGYSSVVFDLLERAAPPAHPAAATDDDALRYHYADVVAAGYTLRDQPRDEDERETTREWEAGPVVFANLPDNPARALLATQHPPRHPSPQHARRPRDPDFTALHTTLLRLPAVQTDVLITVNVPHVPGSYDPQDVDLEGGKFGPLITEAREIAEEIRRSFRIVDWGLFVVDES